MKNNDELKTANNLCITDTGFDGGRGEIQYGKLKASVIWSIGGGWDHVSVSPYKSRYIPSWEEMCKVKDIFFHDDEVVVQYHPAKSEYVNNLPNCLHLWRPQNEVLPVPPSFMVGVKQGQTVGEVIREAKKQLREAE